MNTIGTMADNVRWLAWNLGILAGAVVIAWTAHYLFFAILGRLARRNAWVIHESPRKYCYHSTRWAAAAALAWLSLELTDFAPSLTEFLRHLLSIVFILMLSWLMLGIFRVARDAILERTPSAQGDERRARSVLTQMRILERVVIAIIVVLALGCILMSFEKVRQLGVSLLASAGIIGIVVGMAAQKTLGAVIAGLQIAITQPIRIGDAVMVENEFGFIEDISLTYIVVRLWDERRLILPVTYFIEKPFQNWTKGSSGLLGTVLLYVDYALPVEPLRQELQRVLKESPKWDGKTGVLQVTNVSEKSVEVRALVSAADPGALGDLRCEVREKLLRYLREIFPASLPQLRVEMKQPT